MEAHAGQVTEDRLTQPARDREFEQHVKLGFDESIDIDVKHCDLVEGREPGTWDLRFKGYRAGTSERVRLYCDREMMEGALMAEALIRADWSPTKDGEVILAKNAITIKRQRLGNGSWRFVVKARDQGDVRQWTRAIAEAADTVAPELTSRGYAVGSSEIITIAGALVRRRSHQQ